MTKNDFSWFTESRFGMFIHWGTYAVPGRHEWVRHHEMTPRDAYRAYADRFTADRFCPEDWADRAAEAGMKYMVITAKHHEGFCLWDTALTDYKAPNTPAGRDLLGEVLEAFRSRGIRTGLYYSLIDWDHPHFPIDPLHPERDAPDAIERNRSRDVTVYQEYMRGQLTELLTGYGQIDVLWMDFSYPTSEHKGLKGKGHLDWDSRALLDTVRGLCPGILVNNRLDLLDSADFHTPEQYTLVEPVQAGGKPVLWEACHTLSGSWGYHRDETTWKNPEQLLRLLVESVSLGGNLLMNVGPTARGEFDDRAKAALGVYADWMSAHGESVHGCGAAGFEAPSGCFYTRKDDRLFLHVFAWPFCHLHLRGMAEKVSSATLMLDGSEILLRKGPIKDPLGVMDPQGGDDLLTLVLPVKKPETPVPVIELRLA
jgi:alpha-L-fucosidase